MVDNSYLGLIIFLLLNPPQAEYLFQEYPQGGKLWITEIMALI